MRRLCAATRKSSGERAHRAKYFRKGGSLRVPPHSEKIYDPQRIPNQDGSLRPNYRSHICRGSWGNGNHETIIVLEKYRILASHLRSWPFKFSYGLTVGNLEPQLPRFSPKPCHWHQGEGSNFLILLHWVLEDHVLLAQIRPRFVCYQFSSRGKI